MLGAEFPAIFFRQLRHVDLADVQHRAQRQRDHAPRRMRCQPGQGDPVVSVQPLRRLPVRESGCDGRRRLPRAVRNGKWASRPSPTGCDRRMDLDGAEHIVRQRDDARDRRTMISHPTPARRVRALIPKQAQEKKRSASSGALPSRSALLLSLVLKQANVLRDFTENSKPSVFSGV